ncbi:MAG: DUF975 family protein [Oscillospiraceae bacterium]|nr:DUF975 family protein [Oscillospiraceae bacterium]
MQQQYTMPRQEIKERAKALIKGKIPSFFIIFMIIFGISIPVSLLGMIPVIGFAVSIAWIIFVSWFQFNMVKIFQRVVFYNNTPQANELFDDFNQCVNAAILYLLMGLFTFLWSLLLVVPGIIKGFSYSAAPYIMATNPGMKPLEAINRSKEIMHGRKMDLFVLELSFLGWALLATLTLGILYIWLAPYMGTAVAQFYASIGIVPQIAPQQYGGQNAGQYQGQPPQYQQQPPHGTQPYYQPPQPQQDPWPQQPPQNHPPQFPPQPPQQPPQ